LAVIVQADLDAHEAGLLLLLRRLLSRDRPNQAEQTHEQKEAHDESPCGGLAASYGRLGAVARAGKKGTHTLRGRTPFRAGGSGVPPGRLPSTAPSSPAPRTRRPTMSFLLPPLLWFLPLAALPVLLHLLSLFRLKTLELPTFRFLFDSYVQQRRRLQFL